MSDDRRRRDDTALERSRMANEDTALERSRDANEDTALERSRMANEDTALERSRDANEDTALERSRDANEDAWIERVRDVWSPADPSPTERRAFDARLEARIEAHRQRGWLWLPVRLPVRLPVWQPVMAALVAALTLWLLNGAGSPGPEPRPMARSAMGRPASLAAWELEILHAAEVRSDAALREADDAILPDDYRALAGLLLEGGDIANGH